MHEIQSERKSTGAAVENRFVGYQIAKPNFVAISLLQV
jgi:hypothetical protein